MDEFALPVHGFAPAPRRIARAFNADLAGVRRAAHGRRASHNADNHGEGIVSRGVLIGIPWLKAPISSPARDSSEDLDAWERRAASSGKRDVVLVRRPMGIPCGARP